MSVHTNLHMFFPPPGTDEQAGAANAESLCYGARFFDSLDCQATYILLNRQRSWSLCWTREHGHQVAFSTRSCPYWKASPMIICNIEYLATGFACQNLPGFWQKDSLNCRCPSSWFATHNDSHSDPIWAAIMDHQGMESWGSVLDAGTGQSSLRFITQLNTTQWSAVTASLDMYQNLIRSFKDKIRFD